MTQGSKDGHAQPGTHVYTFTTRPGRQPQRFREFGPYADESEAAQAFQRLFGYWPEAASHVRPYGNEASGDDRARRYAEAVNGTGVIHCTDGTPEMGCDGCQVERDEVVEAVMAVADAEIARAKAEALREAATLVDDAARQELGMAE